MDTTFFLGRETVLVAAGRNWFDRLRYQIFALLSRNAMSASKFFRLPTNRIVEIGAQIEI